MARLVPASPTDITMYPNCESVEYARILFKSVWVQAISAAKRAVKAPVNSTTSKVPPAAANKGKRRAVRYSLMKKPCGRMDGLVRR